MNVPRPSTDITIGWIDNGTVEGKFTQGILHSIFQTPYLTKFLRVSGNHIPEQRQRLLMLWYELGYTDWILFVDSDVVLTPDAVHTLLSAAHPIHKPIISGLYFIYQHLQSEDSIPSPIPCIYKEINGKMKPLTDFEPNKLIEIDAAGLGCTLIHRNAVTLLLETCGDNNPFQSIGDESFGSAEDFAFFAHAKKSGIQLYAHTGVSLQHMKKFALDESYYNKVSIEQ